VAGINADLWARLLEKVIDIEVANHTPSPTVDPSVRTILIGHSMGGIVAADAILALTSDTAIESQAHDPKSSDLNSFMFPYIQGVLAFDTPYLGIAPGVVAHGAEDKYNAANAAFEQLSSLTGAFWGAKAGAATTEKETKEKKPVAALPAPPVATTSTTATTKTQASAWQNWGKIAAFAGAGAVLAAGGAAAYLGAA